MRTVDIITSVRYRLQWEHNGSFLRRDFVTQLDIANTRRARKLWRALRKRDRIITASHARRFTWDRRDTKSVPGSSSAQLRLVA